MRRRIKAGLGNPKKAQLVFTDHVVVFAGRKGVGRRLGRAVWTRVQTPAAFGLGRSSRFTRLGRVIVLLRDQRDDDLLPQIIERHVGDQAAGRRGAQQVLFREFVGLFEACFDDLAQKLGG